LNCAGNAGHSAKVRLGLTQTDGSYFRFNTDGSRYYNAGYPEGKKLYITWAGERTFTPQKWCWDRGTFFTGVDWEYKDEDMCWDDGAGNIVKTSRRNIEDLDATYTQSLRRKLVGHFPCHDGRTRILEVDANGRCTSRRWKDSIVLHKVRVDQSMTRTISENT
jgi:hypothetical protein